MNFNTVEFKVKLSGFTTWETENVVARLYVSDGNHVNDILEALEALRKRFPDAIEFRWNYEGFYQGHYTS